MVAITPQYPVRRNVIRPRSWTILSPNSQYRSRYGQSCLSQTSMSVLLSCAKRMSVFLQEQQEHPEHIRGCSKA